MQNLVFTLLSIWSKITEDKRFEGKGERLNTFLLYPLHLRCQ